MSVEKQIEEGNKLIAIFLSNSVDEYPDPIGKVFKSDYKFINGRSIDSALFFHSSWDLLMPVVDKITEIDITPAPNWTGYRIEIVPRGYVKISGFPMPTICTNVSIEGSLIKAVWQAVVQFIQFYNQQPQL